MKRTAQVFVLFAFFIFAATFSWAGIINQKAPEFTLKDLSGKTVSLNDYRGKVVFIDFWASWCPPCKKEFPEINKFIQKYKDSDVAVLAVNVDKRRANVDDFLSQLPQLSKKMVVLLDTESSVISSYNAKAMPTSFIVDKEGVIRFVHFGYNESDPRAWADEIDKLLK